MQKPKNNFLKILALVFIVLMAASHGDAARNPFKPQLPPPPEPPQQEIISEQPQRPTISGGEYQPPQQNWNYPVTEQPSETIPPVALEEVPPEVITPPVLTVQGVIWKTDRPQAIINNSVVDIGDHILDTQIVSIQKSNIEIEYQGVIFNITP